MHKSDGQAALNNFRKIHGGIESALGRFFWGKDLTAAQGHMLLYILERQRNPLGPTELHRTMGLSRASVSELLKKLRDKGFITLTTEPGDERQKRVEPTEKARDMKRTLDRMALRAEQQIFEGFSPEELGALLCFQMRILENLKQKEENCNGNRSQSDTAV